MDFGRLARTAKHVLELRKARERSEEPSLDVPEAEFEVLEVDGSEKLESSDSEEEQESDE